MKPLVVNELSKNFGGLQALDRVSLSLEEGDRRAIIGPNGAGKTTFFHLISGVLSPTSGRVYLFDHDVTRMPMHRRTAMGMARTFQVTNLFPKLTLMKNLVLALQGLEPSKFSMLRPVTSYHRILSRAEELLEQWQLLDKRDAVVRDLSYGDQRKIEILMAMAQQPKLLLLDEPTAGLSSVETISVVNVVQSLPADVTILLIEHDMDVAFELVNNITVLHMGKVVASGSCQDIRSNALVQEIYLGAKEGEIASKTHVSKKQYEPA